jgi:hypothetical protein
VVFVSDDLDDWEPIYRNQVPARIRRPENMQKLIDGEILCLEEGGPYYIAEICH